MHLFAAAGALGAELTGDADSLFLQHTLQIIGVLGEDGSSQQRTKPITRKPE
jgi:hypothetical protein